MTDLADKLEALAKAATPGPWETYSLDQGVQVRSGSDYLGETRDYTGNDAALIVELVNNLPALIRALRERDQAVELVKRAFDIFSHCTVEDGVCCCGDNMDNHPEPMSGGHTAVDHGAYVTDQWCASASATLASIEGAGDE